MHFSILLWLLGVLLKCGQLLSQRFRNQLTRSRVVEIRSRQGPARHFIIAPRCIRSVAGRAENPHVAIEFESNTLGVQVLLSTKMPTRLVNELLDERLRVEGNIMLLLWFQGLAQMVFPITRPPRLAHTPPDAYISHRASPSVSARITREPVRDALDPGWTSAHRARGELLMIRGSRGEIDPPPLF